MSSRAEVGDRLRPRWSARPRPRCGALLRPTVEELVAGVLVTVKKRKVSLRRVLEAKYRVPSALRATVLAMALEVLRKHRLLDHALRDVGVDTSRMTFRERALAWTVAYGAVFRGREPPSGLKLPFPWEALRELKRLDLGDVLSGLTGVRRLAVEYSVPDWIAGYVVRLLGLEEARRLLRALSEKPVRWARARAPRRVVVEALRRRGVEVVEDPDLPDVFKVTRSGGRLASLPEYRRGLFVLQDKASAHVVHLLKPGPGMTLLDACSAPGVKALHALDLYPGIEVLGVDVSWNRLMDEERLLSEYVREGRVQLVCADSQRLALTRSFERILVDPDCSSLGKLAHSPEVKLWVEPSHVERNARLQYGILRNTARLLERGLLVHSTCTITVEENEEVVRRVVEEEGLELVEPVPSIGDPGIGLPEARRLYPHRHGTAGFFVAVLHKP